MAITSMDTLVAALASSQNVDTYEQSMTAKAAGDYQSLWTAGGRPSAGASPGSTSGVVPTSATAGAIPFTDPTGGNTLYLASFEASGSVTGTIILYDRLVASSGLSGTVTSAQTVGTPSLTRSTSGVGVGLWLEWYTATGGTASNVTVSYTNQAGTSAKTSVSTPLIATPSVGLMLPIPLASGDTGVRAVASVTLSASTGTAGNFGVTLAKRIAQIHFSSASVGLSLDYSALGLPVVSAGACLAYQVLASTTTTGNLLTALCLAQG